MSVLPTVPRISEPEQSAAISPFPGPTSGVGAAVANAVAGAVGDAAARHLPVTAPRVKATLS
jgi:hypothetical protein